MTDFGGAGLAPIVDDRLSWNVAPTLDGLIPLLGWYEQTDTAAALANGTPVTPSVAGFSSHYVLDVSGAVGLPFDVTFTGDTVDENTGVETPADTEVINVTGNGFYQTSKTFVTAPVISVLAGKSATIDVFRTSYWDHKNKDFTLTGARVEWVAGAGAWSINPRIRHVHNDGSIEDVYSPTFASTDSPPRGSSGEAAKDKRGDFNHAVLGAQDEGLVIDMNQTRMDGFFVGIEFRD